MILRHRFSYLAAGAIAIVFLAGILFFNYEKKDAPKAEAAGFVPVVANVMGFAWSNNIGWISFNNRNCDKLPAPAGDGFTDVASPPCPAINTPTQGYGVNLDASNDLSGYAWSSSIGPITFGKGNIGDPDYGDISGCPSGTCQPKLIGANFSGWARACSVFVSGCTGFLKPPEKRGGWDGWISLNSNNCDTDNNGKIDFACGEDNITKSVINYKVSKSGNDFTGFAWGSIVTGWLSFNSINCDSIAPIGKSDGGVGCPTSVTDMSAYKVYLSGPVNNSPTATAGSVTPPDYCNLSATAVSFSPIFNWSFTDPDAGSKQTAYEVQVATDPGFAPISIVHDSTKISSELSRSYTPPGTELPLPLFYNQTYYWHVRVWDDFDAPSAYASSSFGTPVHAYPSVDFSPPTSLTSSFAVNTLIDFRADIGNAPYDSVCYGNGNAVVVCSDWKWDFCNTAACTNKNATGEQVSHKYDISGTYNVVLEVTDSTPNIDSGPFKCSNSSGLKMFSTVKVKWKEVVPK